MTLEPAPDLSTEDRRRLLDAAETARKNAYNPNSGLYVGAALLTADDEIFLGSNVGATSQGYCAERSAVLNAVSHGKRDFVAVAVIAAIDEPITPCGICRQLLIEFAENAGSDIQVIMANTDGKTRTAALSDLLPSAFSQTMFDWE